MNNMFKLRTKIVTVGLLVKDIDI